MAYSPRLYRGVAQVVWSGFQVCLEFTGADKEAWMRRTVDDWNRAIGASPFDWRTWAEAREHRRTPITDWRD